MVRALLRDMGMPEEEVEARTEGNLKEEGIAELRNVTSRFLQQTIGTDWARETVYEDFWVDVAVAKIKRLLDKGRSVVVDDLRFPNEYVYLRDMGAHLWWVKRPGFAASNRYEGRLDDKFIWSARVLNGGTLEELRHNVKLLMIHENL